MFLNLIFHRIDWELAGLQSKGQPCSYTNMCGFQALQYTLKKKTSILIHCL